MFIEFRTVKNLVSKSDIFTPFCYKFIQVTACKTLTYKTSAWHVTANQQGSNFYASWCI